MQGAPKRQVNAEDMLAELKRALETSTPAPDASLRAVSTAPKPSSPVPEGRRSHAAKANAKTSIGPRTDLQKSTGPSSRTWKLIAGGLALAAVAAISVSFAFIYKAPDLSEREPSVAATESVATPQDEQPLGPASSPGSAAPASAPALPDQAPALVASHKIGPDGAPMAPAPPTQASPDPAPPLAEASKTAAASAVSHAIGANAPPDATAPSAPASTLSTPPLAEAPKTPLPPTASQAIRPDGPSIAAAPPGPAPTHTAPPAERPKSNATQTASVSNDSAEPSTPKADSKKKPAGKPSPQKPRAIANASAKPTAQAERQSTEPAQPKEAEKSAPPAQDAGVPAAPAPVKSTSVQQRVSDGVTHAFGYLMHLPGALVPHLGGPSPDAH
jgi:hypothetical protein